MRLFCLSFLLLAAPCLGQTGTPASERNLGRIGVALGPPGARGPSLFAPSVGYDASCAPGVHYACGTAVVAFLVDGEYEYDVFSSHTLFLAPRSPIDPYVSGFLGVGYGDGFGIAWGTEVGINFWVTETGGVSLYGGHVEGERHRYIRIGIGLVYDAGL